MPGLPEWVGAIINGSRIRWSALLLVAGAVGLYVGLPQIAGLDETWRLLGSGDPLWLVVAVAFEICSYGSYVLAFRGIAVDEDSPIDWRATYEITMAGVAATRLLATAGAGGIALTAWALSRSGMTRTDVARRLATFYAALYGVYMIALVTVGISLSVGLLAGTAPLGTTVVPAIFGGVVISVALGLALVPPTSGSGAPASDRWRDRCGRRLAQAGGAVSAGVRGAVDLLRRRDPAVLGAAAWWGFDIAVLWACLHAFGEPPTIGVIVMAYFTGMLGNLLPLPGGIGGVEGGMIGALIAFDVASGLAIISVLSYRAFAFWLPTIPGLVAYVRLRRRVTEWDGARAAPS